MRKILNFNQGWSFIKKSEIAEKPLPADRETVDLPHTWNAVDGQDGGNDYYRGTCIYSKTFSKDILPEGEKYFLEINAANSSADVYLNGKELCHHDGGYSTWRVDLTKELSETNTLEIAVDNSPNDYVYPQMADFTFYGGLYRDVNIIAVSSSHFDLSYYGGQGLMVTPKIEGKNASVALESYVTNKKDSQKVIYTISDGEGNIIARTEDKNVVIENVRLWHGRKDPYLYTCKAELTERDRVIDSVATLFGCRSFEIDPERGFILNGEEYPLRGVSRHQDRWGIGNALLPEHHREDMELISEVGATTIRLAHYQHDAYFYDLCDRYGMVVWAEIPYISRHLPKGRENTISQMKELVIQNYNHPSIVVWGLSNEITMGGDRDEDLLSNHRQLNDLVHELDKTRLTTVAAVSMCPMDSPYLKISDVVSYNHYFGWYGGDTSINGPWFDEFHAMHPSIPIGCSEYGCEGLDWHTSNPEQGDYTEEYQAYYHEELIRQLFSRKYLWATHVWNMFDFGADARAEGGEDGQNHKGLVTIDRKYKKDAFYAYKAWLSEEKFVHLCGKRYIDRVEDVTKVTVYSNLPEVELFANSVSLGKKKANDHFFYFDVPNKGETALKAVAGEYTDESVIRKVEVFNEKYRLKEKNAILNWFDVTTKEGYFSLNDKLDNILATKKGKLLFKELFAKFSEKSEGEEKSGFYIDMNNSGFMKMLGGFTVLRLTSLLAVTNIKLTKEDLLELNRQLNKIKKPKK